MSKNLYISVDKVGEFFAAMYAKGIKADADPVAGEITVHKKEGGYEWVKVVTEVSVDELCNALCAVNEESHE